MKNTKKNKFPVFYYHSFSNKKKPRTFLIANKHKQKKKDFEEKLKELWLNLKLKKFTTNFLKICFF